MRFSPVRRTLLTTAVAASLASVGGGAFAQNKIKLRLSSPASATDQRAVALVQTRSAAFVERVYPLAPEDRLAAGAHRDEVVRLGNLALVAGVDPVAFEDQLHLQIEEFWLGEHVAGDTEHALIGAEVQAAVDEVLPLLDASCTTHGRHLFDRG